MRRCFATLLLIGCGSNSTPEPSGPVLTPGVSYALQGIAKDCALSRDGDGELRTCRGLAGTVEIRLAAHERIRAIEIRLGAMFRERARVLVEPAVTPLLKTDAATLGARIEQMANGDRATLQLAGAAIEVSASGRSTIAPEWRVTLTY